jgi:hypothetical protein
MRTRREISVQSRSRVVKVGSSIARMQVRPGTIQAGRAEIASAKKRCRFLDDLDLGEITSSAVVHSSSVHRQTNGPFRGGNQMAKKSVKKAAKKPAKKKGAKKGKK